MDFNQISEWLSKWGFWQLMCIFIITALTMALKIPIKKAAEKYQEKTGIDKSFITWTISAIPLVLGFAAALVLELWGDSWDVNLIDWADVTKQGAVLGGASIGVFEAFKKWAEALFAKKNAKGASSPGEAVAEEPESDEPVAEEASEAEGPVAEESGSMPSVESPKGDASGGSIIRLR